MTPAALLEKADRALASAETLLREGDTEGACNRSYYAMFNAARAALILIDAPQEVTQGKSHNGLHSAFNQYLVKPGHISQALGAEFRRAERLRQISDYLGDPIESGKAAHTLHQACELIHLIRTKFMNL